MTSDLELLKRLGTVGPAFFGGFDALREVQRASIPAILSGANVIVSSATASGKTEAVIAPLVARLREDRQPTMGPRLVAVAPTRALVNDLYARIERPLAALGWTTGRQTSDHADKQKRPDVLVTTPESLDSMLVRDGIRDGLRLTGHLLAGVAALFIDEAHAFDGTARGDQVAWLVGRLKRLRAHAMEQGWSATRDVQVCAASATVFDPAGVGLRILGGATEVVRVAGKREVEVLLGGGAGTTPGWESFENGLEVASLFPRLLRAAGRDDLETPAQQIWSAIENGAADECRKVLVFVPTRRLCDRLSAVLAEFLLRRREMLVTAHHGSLSRERREDAERGFSTRRDAAIVATTTLELGIDIGDVDVVALVGPPPDVASLLQRIGRAGRRIGRTRVIPIARDEIEARAFASLLTAAADGTLDPKPGARRWSVFVQQVASYVAQAGRAGRKEEEVVALAQSVWPDLANPLRASRILDRLVAADTLHRDRERLHLGDELSDRFHGGGGDLHHNLDTGAKGMPVVDASTGEVIAHIDPTRVPSSGTVAVGGGTWNVTSDHGELVVQAVKPTAATEEVFYPTRAAPTGASFAAHVRRGLGFSETDAPIYDAGGEYLWFHFGGAAYEIALRVSLPELRVVKGLGGVALRGLMTAGALEAVVANADLLRQQLFSQTDVMASALSPGPYHDHLPDDVRREVTLELFDVDRFAEWARGRVIWRIDASDPREASIRALLQP